MTNRLRHPRRWLAGIHPRNGADRFPIKVVRYDAEQEKSEIPLIPIYKGGIQYDE
jgi:hypothetical protein